MTSSREPGSRLALDLALTIRHDGRGGVADDLDSPAGLTRWVRERPALLARVPAPGLWTADGADLAAVRSLRAAARALFARAVRPGEPSPADAARLIPVEAALGRLNEAAAAVPAAPRLDWPRDGEPVVRDHPAGGSAADALPAALARAVIGFLTGPDRAALRACHAPRCVRYFVKEHPRQEWCKPSCGNRARVARHHERHRTP
ncbi:CGNR zinc finger domain-containing protein [Streptomyces laculatispora]|uniref:CGNR zinc finger domain-containing protein n=1 Tax=Streptomyces laculatispora TaxID=887464 RepID=A0ABY9IFJ9_9ACTN|nr:CGNR zinc finger domain-containing protein [Streptomyces laculatispora]WLQ44984.1 CGNR zinc finger domain-containing protein [Streptomyces laculatispora]